MIGPNTLHNRFADGVVAAAAGVVLVDPQTAIHVAMGAAAERIGNNLVGLVRVAGAFDVPILIATRRDLGAVIDPIATLVNPGRMIERPDAKVFEDGPVRAAIHALGRRVLFLAAWGLGEEIADIALAGMRAGFDVRVVADASWPTQDLGGLHAIARMTSAGVDLTTWVAVLASLSQDHPATDLPNAAQLAIRESLATYSPSVPSYWNYERDGDLSFVS